MQYLNPLHYTMQKYLPKHPCQSKTNTASKLHIPFTAFRGPVCNFRLRHTVVTKQREDCKEGHSNIYSSHHLSDLCTRTVDFLKNKRVFPGIQN